MKRHSTIKSLPDIPGIIFLLPSALFLLASFILVLIFSREETQIAINGFHNKLLDGLMPGWTFLGDGIFLAVLLLGLLFISYRHFFTVLTAFTFGGLGAQILKHVFFSNFPRPLKYFELHQIDYQLYIVPGIDPHTWLSFPSGHTSTAFAVFFALALFSKNKILQLGLFILAAGVGYSRIYLSQHFLMDVVAGSFLGLISGFTAWFWFRRYEVDWMDSSLFKRLKK